MFHSSLERVIKKRPLHVEWKAFELRPREIPVSAEEQAAKEKMVNESWPQLKQFASETYGLELNQPKLDVDTRLAHVAAKAAEQLGQGAAYHHAIFAAHWQQNRDISDRDTLLELAQEVGIDTEEFVKALDDSTLLDRVMQEEVESRQIGISGVPATVLAGKYLLSGCRPPDELAEILDRIEKETQEDQS